MEYYCERLGRSARSGDWLRSGEALMVLALRHNNRHIASATLSRLASSGRVHTSKPWPATPKLRGYLYDDLVERVIPRPGHAPDEEKSVKSNVRAQRAFRARQRKKKNADGG